jgi:hypothetical protein
LVPVRGGKFLGQAFGPSLEGVGGATATPSTDITGGTRKLSFEDLLVGPRRTS